MLCDEAGIGGKCECASHKDDISCAPRVVRRAPTAHRRHMTAPFCIIGTPRSRTAWLAQFLCHGHVWCEHEPSKGWGNLGDISRYFRENVGAVDSMLTLRWRELAEEGVRLLVVRRARAEVEKSAERAGLGAAHSVLDAIYAELEKIPKTVLRFEYEKLDDRALNTIFFWATGTECPAVWLHYWRGKVIEADHEEVFRRAAANAAGLRNLYKELF